MFSTQRVNNMPYRTAAKSIECTIMRYILAIIVLLTLGSLGVNAQDDIADVKSQLYKIRGNDNANYFLIEPQAEAATPNSGYSLLVIMPGGNGSAQFLPFSKRIYKHAIPPSFLVVQPVAPRWSPDQAIVWPTESQQAPGQQFSTEAFIEAVVHDVAKRHKINQEKVFCMAWSSSGPAAYALATRRKSPFKGFYISMSVFKPKQMGKLTRAKRKSFYIEHSREDQVCPYWMAEKAAKQLQNAGARVHFQNYEGGHGWSGPVYQRIGHAITWLENDVASADTGQ